MKTALVLVLLLLLAAGLALVLASRGGPRRMGDWPKIP